MIHMDNAVFLILLSVVAGAAGLAGAWWQRRKDRREAQLRTEGLPAAVDRLDRIERIVETTALEVERVMEHQRFATRLMADRAEALRPAERRDVEHPTPH